MILEPKKIKSVIVCIVSPSIFHEVMGLDAMILVFCMLSFKPTFYAEYLMQNAMLDEAQAGIKIARRNINNLGYVDDTTLMADREELRVS